MQGGYGVSPEFWQQLGGFMPRETAQAGAEAEGLRPTHLQGLIDRLTGEERRAGEMHPLEMENVRARTAGTRAVTGRAGRAEGAGKALPLGMSIERGRVYDKITSLSNALRGIRVDPLTKELVPVEKPDKETANWMRQERKRLQAELAAIDRGEGRAPMQKQGISVEKAAQLESLGIDWRRAYYIAGSERQGQGQGMGDLGSALDRIRQQGSLNLLGM